MGRAAFVVGEKPPGSMGDAMRAMGPYLSLGWNFALTVVLGILAGWWLDRKFRTGPWLTLAGIALGMTAAFVAFFRVVLPGKKGNGKP